MGGVTGETFAHGPTRTNTAQHSRSQISRTGILPPNAFRRSPPSKGGGKTLEISGLCPSAAKNPCGLHEFQKRVARTNTDGDTRGKPWDSENHAAQLWAMKKGWSKTLGTDPGLLRKPLGPGFWNSRGRDAEGRWLAGPFDAVICRSRLFAGPGPIPRPFPATRGCRQNPRSRPNRRLHVRRGAF